MRTDPKDQTDTDERALAPSRLARRGLRELMSCESGSEPLDYLMVFALAVLPMVQAIWLLWRVLLYSFLFDAFVIDSPFI